MDEAPRPVVQCRGLAVIEIHVTDLERSLAFYQGVLGFEKGEQMLEPGITLTAGDASIYLTGGREGRSSPAGRSPEIELCLVVGGVRAAAERLKDAGVPLVRELDVAGEHFGTLTVADPDGNPVSLWGQP